MHELGVAERILSIATAAADANGKGRIVRIRLRVGALAQVDPETLRFACEVLGRGTSAEGSAIEITTVPARLFCPTCGGESERDLLDPCPCGALGGQLRTGRDLQVDSIDVDDTPRSSAPSRDLAASTT